MTRELPEGLELTDGIVTLRHWSRHDVDDLAAIWQDVELQRRFGVAPPVTTESTTAYVDGTAERWRDGVQISLAIDAGGTLVGGCDLDDLDTDEPDLGYWIAAHSRGHGYAARAGRLLLGWAASNLTIDTVLLVVEPDNTASIAVARELGFRRVAGREVLEDDRRLEVWTRPVSR